MARLAGAEIVAEGSHSAFGGDSGRCSMSSSDSDQSSSLTAGTNNRPSVLTNHFAPRVEFPFLVFLASGGHTSIQLCRGLGEYTVLGGTLDDSLGEAFDKAARLLDLQVEGFSGGVAVERAAALGDHTRVRIMRDIPMRQMINCDFSYAGRWISSFGTCNCVIACRTGMKNAFRVAVEQAQLAYTATNSQSIGDCNVTEHKVTPDGVNQHQPGPEGEGNVAPTKWQFKEYSPLPPLPSQVTADLAAAFQHLAFAHAEDRLSRALNYVDREKIAVTALVVVGGVAANLELRR